MEPGLWKSLASLYLSHWVALVRALQMFCIPGADAACLKLNYSCDVNNDI